MRIQDLNFVQRVCRARLTAAKSFTIAILALCSPSLLQAQDGHQLIVGAAIRDVTPGFDLLPVPWNNGMVVLDGVADPIHVRVLALSDGEATALILSTETGRGPYGPQFAKLVADHAGLPLEAILYTTTHAHAAPEFSKNPATRDAGPDDDIPNAERWAIMTAGKMLEAVDEALANMQPATVGLGKGKSYVNVNRMGSYLRDRDGQIEPYHAEGYNPDGASDKELYVLEFRDMNDVPIAFVVDYAVHGVVMFGNTMGPGGRSAISSDISGYVSTQMENADPGTVALWLSGAAGDQNPLISNHLISRDPATGAKTDTFIGEYELLKYIGRIHYYDIQQTLAGITETTGDVQIKYGYAGTTIPAQEGGQFHVGLQLLRIGDIALMGFSGELFAQLGLDIKVASPLPDTMVVTHARQREEQYSGYHSDDASARRGFHSNPGYAPGNISEALVELTHQLMEN